MSFYTQLYSKVSNFILAADSKAEYVIDDKDVFKEVFRIAQYRTYWQSWHNLPKYQREFTASKQLSINLSRAFVDRSADFLIANPLTPHSINKYSKFIAPVLEYIESRGGLRLSNVEVVHAGSIAGDAMVKVIWDEAIQAPRFQVLDAERTFLEYETLDKSRTNLKSAVIVWEGLFTFPSDFKDTSLRNQTKWVLYKEEWTKTTVKKGIEYKVDTKDKTNRAEKQKLNRSLIQQVFGGMFPQPHTKEESAIETFELSSKKNDLGFIPVVHFRNQLIPLETYGRSDLTDLIPLNLALNEASNQYRDTMHYHGNPITIIKGAKVGNLRKGANKIWSGIPKDGDVYNLGGDNDAPGIQKLMSMLLDYAYLTGSIPEASSGLFQNISNTSGVALQVQYLPLIGLTKRKQLTYGAGFSQAYEYSLRMIDKQLSLGLESKVNDFVKAEEEHIQAEMGKQKEKMGDDSDAMELEQVTKRIEAEIKAALPARKFYEVNIVWGDFLPKDTMIQLNEIEREIELGLESIRGAMVKRGEPDPDAKLKEIQDEKEKNLTDTDDEDDVDVEMDERFKPDEIFEISSGDDLETAGKKILATGSREAQQTGDILAQKQKAVKKS